MTLMACPEPIMAQESAYLEALGAAETYEISGDQLTLYDADGNPLVVFSAVMARTWSEVEASQPANWLATAMNSPPAVRGLNPSGPWPAMPRESAWAIVGVKGGVEASLWLLKMLWAQEVGSRSRKPMLVAQMKWNCVWFTLCWISALLGVRQDGSPPVLHWPLLIPTRGRPVLGSTLRL